MKQIITILLFLMILPLAFGDLQVGFYASSCPEAESIVQQVVQKRFNIDKSITAAMLRMHFHDCFIRGCDASILINSTEYNAAEKDDDKNEGMRGYDLIDEVKESLEAACPLTVSCADIITLATRDAVALSGGPKYDVPTGRRDGLVSCIDEVHIPGPRVPVHMASRFFADKGFTIEEMVTLFGAHTVGTAHCHFFSRRFVRACGGKYDPTMDPELYAKLVKSCNSTMEDDPIEFMDQSTPFVVDNEYYKQIVANKGVLRIDQQLALHEMTKDYVLGFASNGDKFRESFASVLIKLGKVEVLVGNEGEIRKNCWAFNNPKLMNGQC